VIWATLLVIFTMVASGNRSPILGCAVFLILYACMVYRRNILFLMLGGILMVPVLMLTMDSISDAGLRVLETGDSSSEGRVTLSYYGLLLFLAQPFGYGLSFDPKSLWYPHWDAIQWTPSPVIVQMFPLHNYPLSILNMYGAICLLFLPKVWQFMSRSWAATLCFAPYFINLLFHNGGPMWYDYFVWFAFGIAAVAISEADAKDS